MQHSRLFAFALAHHMAALVQHCHCMRWLFAAGVGLRLCHATVKQLLQTSVKLLGTAHEQHIVLVNAALPKSSDERSTATKSWPDSCVCVSPGSAFLRLTKRVKLSPMRMASAPSFAPTMVPCGLVTPASPPQLAAAQNAAALTHSTVACRCGPGRSRPHPRGLHAKVTYSDHHPKCRHHTVACWTLRSCVTPKYV